MIQGHLALLLIFWDAMENPRFHCKNNFGYVLPDTQHIFVLALGHNLLLFMKFDPTLF